MRKRLLRVSLCAILVFAAIGFGACTTPKDTKEEQKNQTAEIVQKDDETLKQLQEQIAELQKRISDYQQQITDFNQQMNDFQNDIERLLNRINMLEIEVSYGTFFTLREAYDKGILVKSDLEQIAYYNNENVHFLQTIDDGVEAKIKHDWAIDLMKYTEYAEAEGVSVIRYYGEFSGSHIVRINDIYTSYYTEPVDFWEEIDGVSFHITYHDSILVWKAN